MVLAPDEPVTVTAVVSALPSRFSKFVTLTLSPEVWSTPAATAKSTSETVEPPAGPAYRIPRRHRPSFGAVEGHRVVARAGTDDVGTAPAVDHIRPGAAADDVGARSTLTWIELRRGQAGSIDVRKVRDRRQIARGLIGRRQIDRRRRAHHQRIIAASAVDRDFGAPIVDAVIARAGGDDIRPASAMDGVIARTCGDRVGPGRARDGKRRRHRTRRRGFRN